MSLFFLNVRLEAVEIEFEFFRSALVVTLLDIEFYKRFAILLRHAQIVVGMLDKAHGLFVGDIGHVFQFVSLYTLV